MFKNISGSELTGVFGNQLLRAACKYAIPLFWSTKNGTYWTVINNNSTAFILDCGNGPFVVTAAHVY